MSRKISTLDKKEKRELTENLEAKSTELGISAWDGIGDTGDLKALKDLVGICANCTFLRYCKTEFGNVIAVCSEFRVKLNGQNRMVECNLHAPTNVLSLDQMYAMAYLIEPSEEKVRGFITKDKKFRPKKPKESE